MFLWTSGGEHVSWRYLTKESFLSEDKKENKEEQQVASSMILLKQMD